MRRLQNTFVVDTLCSGLRRGGHVAVYCVPRTKDVGNALFYMSHRIRLLPVFNVACLARRKCLRSIFFSRLRQCKGNSEHFDENILIVVSENFQEKLPLIVIRLLLMHTATMTCQNRRPMGRSETPGAGTQSCALRSKMPRKIADCHIAYCMGAARTFLDCLHY